MTAISGSACGAAAYVRTDDRATHSSSASGFAAAGPGDESWREWTRRIDDLLSARTLADDWDGQGAVAPHPALVDGAITLALSFQTDGTRPADFVIPGVNGTVVFEWHDPVEYVEVEVTAPDRAVRRAVKRETGETQVNHLVRRC